MRRFTVRSAKRRQSTGLAGKRWSDPATWGGVLPTSADEVIIPAGETYILDVPDAVAAYVDNRGTLVADPDVAQVGLTIGYYVDSSTGRLEIGTEAAPYTKLARITLNGVERKVTDGSLGRTNRYVADWTGYNHNSPGMARITRLATRTGVLTGDYTVTFSSSTAFTVTAPGGAALGSGTVGTIFDNQIRFMATSGTPDWANGSVATISVEQFGFVNDGEGRSLQVMGQLSLVGVAPAVKRTKLAAHVAAAATSMTLADSVGWAAGDEIAVGATDWYGSDWAGVGAGSESFTLASASGTSVTTTTAAARAHYGLLQYVVDTGLSNTAGTLTKPSDWSDAQWADVPKAVDERAPVINLTRNIVIEGANDTAWTSSGFGAHCMVMTSAANAVHVDGVEFRRMGQAGAIGRYPFHWHMRSYNMPDGSGLPTDGTFTGALTGHYIKNCAIHQSKQRAVVVHGTHGVTVHGNVAYDIVGHAFFFEDGAEQNNVCTDNVAMRVREPAAGNHLLANEKSNILDSSAGFWLSNPKNTVTGNWANDTIGPGHAWAWYPRPLGLCDSVTNMEPHFTMFTALADNVAMGARANGTNNQIRQQYSRGYIMDATYDPRVGDVVGGTSVAHWVVSGLQHYKNKAGGYLNRVGIPHYTKWISADNGGQDFQGATRPEITGIGDLHLNVGHSLNNATAYSTLNERPRSAYATYHGTLQFNTCLLVNFPYANAETDPYLDERGGGAFATNDLYIEALDVSFDETYRIHKLGTTAVTPYRSKERNSANNWVRAGIVTFSDVICDPNGQLGRPSASKKFWAAHTGPLYTGNFTTYGLSDLEDATGAVDNNGKWTAAHFFGIGGMIPDWKTLIGRNEYEVIGTVVIERVDAAMTVLASKQWTLRPDHATRAITDKYYTGWSTWCAASGGIYRVTYPTPYFDAAPYGPPSTEMRFRVFLGDTPSEYAADIFTVGVPWGGTATPTTVKHKGEGGGATRFYSSVASFALVNSDTTGSKYWVDTTNKLIWLRVKGDMVGGGAAPRETQIYVNA